MSNFDVKCQLLTLWMRHPIIAKFLLIQSLNFSKKNYPNKAEVASLCPNDYVDNIRSRMLVDCKKT